MCQYNLRGPHKNTWELKPEYRHYKDEDEEDGGSDADESDDADDDKMET